MVWSCFAHTLLALGEGRLPSEVFARSDDSSEGQLIRLTEEESGLYLPSKYEDPRAWTSRLEPATIGTVGTGVGVGDFDGDGYPDLFVALREGKNRLYLNREGNGFEDFTEMSGILESPDWTTGVTVVDLNGDELPDIYVCYYNAPNYLYLNRGDAKFEELGASYGIDVSDASSGAFFADYDKDGDLDLYLQTNTLEGNGGGGQLDYFFLNEGDGSFRDISETVGLLRGEEGRTLGHSVLWVDYDGDGWEDLYVANDFKAPDFLYLNNREGGFELANERLPIAPYSSMGADLGDVDCDGRLDILTTDMASPSYAKHVESMLTSAVKTRDLPERSKPPQVMKNALLLNRGQGDYIDVAYAWGIAATDWTWAPRLLDLDNDGWLDALITNGMIRQFHNADLALAQDKQQSPMAKTAVFKRSPVLAEETRVFKNSKGRGFSDASIEWGYGDLGVSFGAAVFDMDRDGDLDFVYTNYEAPPTIWKNSIDGGNSVQIVLRGDKRNRDAIGARVVAEFGGRKQSAKLLSNRGYLGSDEKLIHFGLGEETQIDRVEIYWPNGSKASFGPLEAGKRYVIDQEKTDSTLEVREAGDASLTRLEIVKRIQGKAPQSINKSTAERAGLLYPLKPLPVVKRPRFFQEDFNRDGKKDTLIMGDWSPPRLILSTDDGMSDRSEEWGLNELRGLWETVLLSDFNADGFTDVFLGGLGLNNEVTLRGGGEASFLRVQGKFSQEGPLLNLNAYNWNGQMRLYDGLRDYVELEPRIFQEIDNFKESGELDYQGFVERVGFEARKEHRIDHFASGVLVNVEGKGFRFQPLSWEGQYGRVWSAVSDDFNGDGNLDLLLLLGQVSPHYRSSQDEGSFLTMLWGKVDGSFEADRLSPIEQPLSARIVDLTMEDSEGGGRSVRLQLEDGSVLLCRVRGL